MSASVSRVSERPVAATAAGGGRVQDIDEAVVVVGYGHVELTVATEIADG